MHELKHTGPFRWSTIVGLMAACWLGSCASEVESEQEPIIGSNQIIERETPVSVLESLRIRLPFKVSLRNGEPKKVLLRGEDNLLEQITLDEEAVNSWRLMAQLDLKFTQHAEIEISVPYIDMVKVTYNRDNVRFIDKPGSFLREPASAP